jgi:hypothetical protein
LAQQFGVVEKVGTSKYHKLQSGMEQHIFIGGNTEAFQAPDKQKAMIQVD